MRYGYGQLDYKETLLVRKNFEQLVLCFVHTNENFWHVYPCLLTKCLPFTYSTLCMSSWCMSQRILRPLRFLSYYTCTFLLYLLYVVSVSSTRERGRRGSSTWGGSKDKTRQKIEEGKIEGNKVKVKWSEVMDEIGKNDQEVKQSG